MEAIGGVEQEWARRDRIAPKLCLVASPLRVLSPKSIRLSSTPSASAGRRNGNSQARRLLLPIRWAAPLPRLSRGEARGGGKKGDKAYASYGLTELVPRGWKYSHARGSKNQTLVVTRRCGHSTFRRGGICTFLLALLYESASGCPRRARARARVRIL